MSETPFGMDFAENTRFYKHFHQFPSILEPPEPARGPPKASQITSRPGPVGMAFWLRMMGNVMFYKGFCMKRLENLPARFARRDVQNIRFHRVSG